MSGPQIKRGKSRQDYETPADFIEAVENKFGEITFDLAASRDNTKAPRYYSTVQDSLKKKWELSGLLWLNPPFSSIGPWAKKCSETQAEILFLVPASVGSNWFRDYVHRQCDIYFLNGRITFVGEEQAYPKDCILCHYHCNHSANYTIWTWKNGN